MRTPTQASPKSRHGLPERLDPCITLPVPPTLDHHGTPCHDGVDRAIALTEHDRVEQGIALQPDQRRMVRIERDQVRGRAHFESPGCLLYTSPSPRDRTRSRMPSSA